MTFAKNQSLKIFIASFLVLLIGIIIIYSYSYNRITKNQRTFADDIVSEISVSMENISLEKVKTVKAIAIAPVILSALQISNENYSRLSQQRRDEEIQSKNLKWKSISNQNNQFILEYTDNAVSRYLKIQQDNIKGEYGEIFITDKYGALIASTAKLTTYAHGNKYWWKGAYNNGEGAIFLDDRGYDDSVGGYVLGVVVPIKNGNEIIGIFKANLNILGSIDATLLNANKDKTEQLFLMRSDGLIIYKEGLEPLSKRVPDKLLEKILNNEQSFICKEKGLAGIYSRSEIGITSGKQGYCFGGSFRSIDHKKGNTNQSWYIVGFQPISHIIKKANNNLQIFLLIGIILSFVLAIMSLIIGNQAAKPIKELIKQTLNISEGDYSSKVFTKRTDEIGQLSLSFNKMTRNLKETTTSLDKLNVEIAERKEAEAKIEMLSRMPSENPHPVLRVEQNGTIIYANNASNALLQTWKSSIGETLPKFLCDLVYDIYKDVRIKEIEFTAGDQIFSLVIVPITGASILNIYGRDITETKKAGDELKKSLDEFERFFNLSAYMVCIASPEGTFRKVSPAFTETLGFSEKEFLTKPFADFVHPDDKKATIDNMEPLGRGIPIIRFPNRYICKDGSYKWLEWTARSFVNGGDIYAIAYDITERKHAEDALRRSETTIRNKLKAITEPTGDIESLDLADIVDSDALQLLMDQFHKVMPVASAIGNLSGKVVASVGWQDICTRFHRCHPETATNCHESDTILAGSVPLGTFKAYHCKNNMWDMAAPIEIAGKHFGNIFIGQFFYADEEPDINQFKQMALKYGFDEVEYLAALERVPRLTRQTADAAMAFLSELAKLISHMSFSTIQQSRLIAERELSERSLRESEEIFRGIYEQSPIAIEIYDIDGILIDVNQQSLKMFGVDDKKDILGFILWENPHYSREQLKTLKNGKPVFISTTFDFESIKSNKSYPTNRSGIIYVDIYAIPLMEKEKVTGYLVQIMEVTDRKKAEKEIQESEEKFRNAITHAPYPIMIHANGKVLQLSEEWIKQTGYTIDDISTIKEWSLKAYGKDAVPSEEYIEKLYTIDKTQYDGEWKVKTKDGSDRLWNFSTSPIGTSPNGEKMVISMAFDITESKRAEKEHERLQAQLQQAQKMESVGRLAGGVAHDYNNISSIILGYSELALNKVEQSNPLHDDLTEIFTAAKRSADITKQLLAFARKQTITPKVLDLNDTIGDLLKMLRRLIGEDIDLTWIPGAEIGPIKIDPSQINQIMANLCVNARDAIANVGKVTVETKNIDLDKKYCVDHEGTVPGEYIQLSVSDDGCGMTPETRDNIFEPFFTTKGIGKGTGLGLSTVYGIVKQNKGFVNVYSETEKGTTFIIYLPIHIGKTVKSDKEKPIKLPLSRGETVLLAEDDESILKIAKRILENLGYTVLFANNPAETIKLAAEHANKINLLLTDVVMPTMNGRELSEHLQRLYPNLKTLFMSGYTADIIAKRGVLDGGVSFISKPFSNAELAVKVREVLDQVKS